MWLRVVGGQGGTSNYSVTYVLRGLTTNGSDVAKSGDSFKFTLEEDIRMLPDSITIKINDTELSNDEYSYDKDTGEVIIDEVNGDVVVRAIGKIATSWIYAPTKECKYFVIYRIYSNSSSAKFNGNPPSGRIGIIWFAREPEGFLELDRGYNDVPVPCPYPIPENYDTGRIPSNIPLYNVGIYNLSANVAFSSVDSQYTQQLFTLLENKLHDYTYYIPPISELPNSYDRGSHDSGFYGYAVVSSPRSPQYYDLSRYELEIYATNVPNLQKLIGFTATSQRVPYYVYDYKEWVLVDGYVMDKKQYESVEPEKTIEYEQIRVIPSEEE